MKTKIQVDELFFWLFILWVTVFVLEGPLRLLLQTVNLELILYLRDGLLLFMVIYQTIDLLSSQWMITYHMALAILVFCISGVASLIYCNVYMLLFGIKVLLPIFAGILYYPILCKKIKTKAHIFRYLLLIVLSGLILEVLISDLPWKALTSNVMNVEIEATRDIQTLLFPRLAGFTRSSFDASIQLLIFGVIILSFFRTSIRWWILAGVGIFLTTTKGIIMSFLVITSTYIFNKINPQSKLTNLSAVIICLLMVLLPSLACFTSEFNEFSSDDSLEIVLYASLFERLFYVWPETFKIILDNGNALLGRGIGGIGQGQFFFEPHLYMPADNLFLLGYAYFGVFFIILLAYLLVKVQRLELVRGSQDYLTFFLILGVLVYGVTSNILENPLLGFFIGYSFKHITSENNQDVIGILKRI